VEGGGGVDGCCCSEMVANVEESIANMSSEFLACSIEVLLEISDIGLHGLTESSHKVLKRMLFIITSSHVCSVLYVSG